MILDAACLKILVGHKPTRDTRGSTISPLDLLTQRGHRSDTGVEGNRDPPCIGRFGDPEPPPFAIESSLRQFINDPDRQARNANFMNALGDLAAVTRRLFD